MDRFLGRLPRPSGVLAYNDTMASLLVARCRELGIAVPGDVALTGCDDDPASGILGLTTLHMPMIDLGREAGRLLFDRLGRRDEQPPARHSRIEMTLRIRDTSQLKA